MLTNALFKTLQALIAWNLSDFERDKPYKACLKGEDSVILA